MATLHNAAQRRIAGPGGVIDGHLDLASLGVTGRDLLAERSTDSAGCVTIPALKRGGIRLTCATIFTESGGDPSTNPLAYRGPDDHRGAAAAARRQLEWYEALEADGVLRLIRSVGDLPSPEDFACPPPPETKDPHQPPGRTRSTSPLAVVLLMEGADPIRDAEDAAWWVDRGVRLVGLSWARGSRFAGGNAAPGGLTAAGRDLVGALDQLGVIHDLSHLSDAGFDDVMSRARGAVVASHSNCRSLTGESQRHLRDDQIAAIARRGGVVGLNLFGRFLVSGRRATLDDALLQVRRVHELGGAGAPVLGSDLDGGFTPAELPVGLESPEQIAALVEAVGTAGVDPHAFAWSNWLRVLRCGLPGHDATPLRPHTTLDPLPPVGHPR
jgi:membrane dipeptidase